MISLIKDFNAMLGTNVKYARCENTGENVVFESSCKQKGMNVQFEYTVTGT